MKVPSARIASWGVVAVVTALLAAIGIFVGWHIDSTIDTATRIARPHEVQTALEHTKGTLDALQDSVQDYVIDGADGMRYQYEDAVRLLGSQAAELSAGNGVAMAANDMEQIDRHIKDVLSTSRAVIDLRNSARPETLRPLVEAATAAVNGARRHLDTLIAAQQESLHERERTLRQDVAQMYGGMVAAAAIVVCVLAGAVLVVDYDRRRSVAMQDFLRSENERLEGAVRERSATLAEANRELTWFSKRALPDPGTGAPQSGAGTARPDRPGAGVAGSVPDPLRARGWRPRACRACATPSKTASRSHARLTVTFTIWRWTCGRRCWIDWD